jgi:hypothetical protein
MLLGASAAALVFLAAWRSQDGRLRRLEGILERREAGWADRFDRLEVALARREAPPQGESRGSKAANSRDLKPPTPTDRPTDLMLARIEARLGELGQRLEQGQARRDQDDQRGAEIQRDLDRLRQQVEMTGRARRQEGQELGTTVHEMLQLLRRLASQSGPMQMMPVPVPVPPSTHEQGVGQGPGMIPVPGPAPNPAQVPGTARMQPARGRSNR